MKIKKHTYEKVKKETFKYKIKDFYKPFLQLFEDGDLYRPEGQDFVYQLTGLQCLLTFVLTVLWWLGGELLNYIVYTVTHGSFNYHITFWVMAATLPYVIYVPRYLLPWRRVEKHKLYVVRWKSRWGFILALFGGSFVGWALALSLFDSFF